MAFEDELRSFLENRLREFDPSIDLSANSPAQLQIIDPTLSRFGEDPFSTDIRSFIVARLTQEYPELAATNGGELEDLLVSPMQTLLEPFKREIELIRTNQSVGNADLMSDDEADALGANFFENREEGSFSTGQVRLYFTAPTTVRVTTDRQLTSRSGVAFFPTSNTFITSAQMVFNRDGNQFFHDITVRAEEAGAEGNAGLGEIISIDDVEGVVRVSNLSDFDDGAPRQTNEDFLGGISQALTERSLVTTRGIVTQVPDTFGTQVRALQVIGAGEDGMNRDILKGTSEGFLHLLGDASFFQTWIIVGTLRYKDDGVNNDVTIQPGDTARLILALADDADRTAHEAIITDIISADVGLVTEKHILILDRTLSTAIGSSGTGAVVAVFKTGFITISELPGGISTGIVVPENEIHLGGHVDIMVRPTSDAKREGVLPNLTDNAPLLALLDIVTIVDDNIVTSATDLVVAGIKAGDLLVIEEGASAGSYGILSVGLPDADTAMRVDTLFASSEIDLRSRIIRNITVDLVEPKVPKVPFIPGPVSDLQTAVGTALFRLGTDIQSFGVIIGDTIRVLDGLNAGDYIIDSFDAVLGGKGPIVDRSAAATGANQRYEVFTASDGLEFPLVRIKTLEVLDSTNQGTGITVPYGDAVDVRPICDFEGAGKSVRVLDKQLIVVPDASGLWGLTGASLGEIFVTTPGVTNDARYSKELSIADGRVRTATSTSIITEFEFNIPPFVYNGRRDTLIALDTREDPEFVEATGTSHRTSDIAESKIGDSLVILDGPNAGNYIIRDLRVLEMWGKTTTGHRKIALVQVDEALKVDGIGTIIDYIADTAATTGVTAVTINELATFFELAVDFFGGDGFIEDILIPRLVATLNHSSQGFSVDEPQIRKLVLDLATTGYDIGESAIGTLRLFFQEPVSVQFFFEADNPTLFQVVGNSALRYRLSPNLPPAQIFPESEEATLPTFWNRDLVLEDAATPVDAFLVAGSSFVKRGIRNTDIIQYHTAINDFVARKDMESSWLVATQAGSNLVRFIVPQAVQGLQNAILPEPGHLFFIDSGPDIGAYVITEVLVGNDLTSDPPDIQFRIDQSLSHTTDPFPPANDDLDHEFQAKNALSTKGNIFPMVLTGLNLKLEIQAVGTFQHSFVSASFADIAALVTELTTGGAWGGSLAAVVAKVDIFADGDELVIRTNLSAAPTLDPFIAIRVPTIPAPLLKFTVGQADGPHIGGVTIAGTKRIVSDGFTAATPAWVVNQWVSVYGVVDPFPAGEIPQFVGDDIIAAGEDKAYLGTFQVVSLGLISGGPRNGEPFLELDRSTDFLNSVSIRWIRHSAPDTAPANTTGGGKELSSVFVRGRMYKEVAEQTIISIPWGPTPASPLEGVDDLNGLGDPDPIQITLVASPVAATGGFAHKMPYRIIRNGVKAISSTAMALNRTGALYFVDLPVVGLGVIKDLNITVDDGLTIEGQSVIDGYVLQVENKVFTFSADEQVSIILPSSVLPVGSTPDLDNEIALAGQNLQVNYDSAPVLAEIQSFFDSRLDRVVVANALVRHFLPSYVFLDVIYVGGDIESLVAIDLISLINNIDPDVNVLSSDAITKIVSKRNAITVQQPINLIVLTHGVDRRIRGTQSKNSIGGSNLPTFQGNFKQTYFIAGPDTSLDDVRPDGEQIFLTRR